MKPVLIVVGLLIAQDPPQMGLVPDESAVWEHTAASPDPAFGDRVHAGVRTLQRTVRIPTSARTASNAAVKFDPLAWEPRWGAIRRRAARSLGESGRSFALGDSTSRTFQTRPDRLEAYFTPRRSLVRSQVSPTFPQVKAMF
jgi:hypothetical protein